MRFLLAGGIIGVCAGFCLGVLATAILAASDEGKTPTPGACTYPQGACLATGQPGAAS